MIEEIKKEKRKKKKAVARCCPHLCEFILFLYSSIFELGVKLGGVGGVVIGEGG